MSFSSAATLIFAALVIGVAVIGLALLIDGSSKCVPLTSRPLLNSPNPKYLWRAAITGSPKPESGKVKALTVTDAQLSAQQKFVALDLGGATNVNFLAELKKESKGPEGIAEDGRAPIPGLVPRAYFQLGSIASNNAIVLSEKTVLILPALQRRKYQELALLHGSKSSGGLVSVALHYARGDDQIESFQVLEWNPKTRKEKPRPNQFAALQTLGADGLINAELFSHVIELDVERVLESISFEPSMNAAIFGVTLIPVE